MNPNDAEEKAFQKAKDFAHKTDRQDTFWKMLHKDIERKKRLIELDEVKRSFDQ